MTTPMSGGCQCGRVRFTAQVGDDDAYLCHCRMCQRASGSVSIAFKIFPKAEVAWERSPDWYDSSPIARRPFCSTCGTPLGFEYHDDENIDLHIAAFDEPHRFVPRHHFGIESRLDQWLDTSHLPGYRIADDARIVARWMNAVGKLPD